MPANPGHLPPETIIHDDDGNVTGYRSVHVVLHSGYSTLKAGAAPWPAKGGRPSDTVWRVSVPPHNFDIAEWELA